MDQKVNICCLHEKPALLFVEQMGREGINNTELKNELIHLRVAIPSECHIPWQPSHVAIANPRVMPHLQISPPREQWKFQNQLNFFFFKT